MGPELVTNKIVAEDQSSDSDYAEDQRMQLMAHMKAIRKHGGHVHGYAVKLIPVLLAFTCTDEQIHMLL